MDSALAAQFGMKKRRRLKPDAVPTIFPKPSTSGAHASEAKKSSFSRRKRTAVSGEGSDTTSKRRSGAAEKRERKEVSCNYNK